MRAIFVLACFAGALVGAYFGQPYVRDNADAVLIIITVLTVFAGFLVAIIAILGDPAMFPDGSWRDAEIRRENVEARLIAHTWLFIAYLVAIALLFSGVLLAEAHVSEEIKTWFERLYLAVGIFAFLLTFALPGMLLKVQMARFESEIARRRRKAGIRDEDESTG